MSVVSIFLSLTALSTKSMYDTRILILPLSTVLQHFANSTTEPSSSISKEGIGNTQVNGSKARKRYTGRLVQAAQPLARLFRRFKFLLLLLLILLPRLVASTSCRHVKMHFIATSSPASSSPSPAPCITAQTISAEKSRRQQKCMMSSCIFQLIRQTRGGLISDSPFLFVFLALVNLHEGRPLHLRVLLSAQQGLVS